MSRYDDMTVLYSTLLDTYTQIYEQLIIFMLMVLGSSFPQWIWNSGLYLLILKFKTALVEPIRTHWHVLRLPISE